MSELRWGFSLSPTIRGVPKNPGKTVFFGAPLFSGVSVSTLVFRPKRGRNGEGNGKTCKVDRPGGSCG